MQHASALSAVNSSDSSVFTGVIASGRLKVVVVISHLKQVPLLPRKSPVVVISESDLQVSLSDSLPSPKAVQHTSSLTVSN